MDSTLQALSGYAARADYSSIDDETLIFIRRHLIDTIACALGGSDAEPVQIARKIARTHSGRPSSRILVHGDETTQEMAAFTNGIMVRYLDYNDSGGSGHPSDGVPAIIAAAEAYGLTGADLLVGIALHYDIGRAMRAPISIRERGWDQGVAIAAGVATAIAWMRGGDQQIIANAISLAIIPNISLQQARMGQLSMWKGAATPTAAKAGVFAAELALNGMTAPGEPFEGEYGFFSRVSGPFEAYLPDRLGEAVVVSAMKFRPAEHQSQAMLEVMEDVRAHHPVETVAHIHVSTYWLAFSEIGMEPEKWRPTSRETADHSMAFLMASTLLHGRISKRDFTPSRYSDPALIELMDKISVSEEPEFSAVYPDEWKSRIEVEYSDGTRSVHMAPYPRGHLKNPMTQDDVEDKFDQMASEVGDASWRAKLLTALQQIGPTTSVAALVDLTIPS